MTPASSHRKRQGGIDYRENEQESTSVSQRSIHTEIDKEEQVIESMCRNQHETQQSITQTATSSTEKMCRNQHVTPTAANQTDSNKQYRGDVQESTPDTAVNHTYNKQYREDVQESTRDTYSS